MSTEFSSVEEAKSYVAICCELDPNKLVFEEVPNLKVLGMDAMLLDDSDTSEEIKQSIRDRIDAQKGFKFQTPTGEEVKIVIGPFRDGFDCWVIGKHETAMRLKSEAGDYIELRRR